LRERGLLVGTAGGNTLRFAPPLIVGEENIDEAYEALYEVFSQIDENARAVTA